MSDLMQPCSGATMSTPAIPELLDGLDVLCNELDSNLSGLESKTAQIRISRPPEIDKATAVECDTGVVIIDRLIAIRSAMHRINQRLVANTEEMRL